MQAAIFLFDHAKFSVEAHLLDGDKPGACPPACTATIRVNDDLLNIHVNDPAKLIYLGERLSQLGRELDRELSNQQPASSGLLPGAGERGQPGAATAPTKRSAGERTIAASP